MSVSLVFDSPQLATDEPLSRLGGKAANLLQLQQIGQPVPLFYVIPATALQQVIGDEVLHATGEGTTETAAAIRQRIAEAALPADLLQAIEAAHTRLALSDHPVAVRSSATAEDGKSHSFAGMHDSLLGVRGFDSLLSAIRQVWASAFSPRAVAYRVQHGLPEFDVGMAVIVQQLVDARQSGVCFTCDPADGSDDKIVISSVYGLGEGLVSRGYAADNFVVSKQSLTITSQLANKCEQLLFDDVSGEVMEVEVPDDRRLQSSLTDDQLRQIADAAIAIEAEFGCPQDIEFCFDESGSLFVLQSRPVTGLGPSRSPTFSKSRASGVPNSDERNINGNRIVWDNSNIIESYSGVTTPMTFSFIRRAYSIVYHCFSEVMGIPPQVVHQHRDAFDNMLGLFRGRVYYNLRNWYRLIRLFPGYRYNSRFMESMMGLKEPLFVDENEEQPGRLRRWFVEFPALLNLLRRSGWNFFRIRTLVEEFQRHFHRHYDEWKQIDFDSMPPHEIIALHTQMEEALLWNWKTPIINDFYVMVYYGVLKKMCASWCGDESGSLQNGLIAGEGGLQSDEPAKLLIHMANIARNDTALGELIRQQPAEELPTLIAGDARFPEFNGLMAQYLDEYGLRCANELKLEAFSYCDQPHRLYQIIRSYLNCDDPAVCDLDAIAARECDVRRDAEQQCEAALQQLRSWWPRRMLFKRVLRNARMGVRNRENMRFARTRIYGILRQMLHSIGRHLADEGLLDDREDVFYLTLDEVFDFVKGTAVSTDLRGLARLRRREYDAYRNDETAVPDDRFETVGMAYHGNSFQQQQQSPPAGSNGSLSGIGCCPGIVSGRIQLVRDPANATDFDGDILVAERTDPGWVALYPAFRGILIERGSPLSHSAIVAREMGIPTIVSVADLTKRLQTGDHVRMDGQAGVVQIIESDEPR